VSNLLERLLLLVPLVLSLSVHEWAHAFSAYRLGDDTAERQGRMTLDPLAHIDMVGTLLLPLLGIPFGWAKPVPVNPMRFRRSISMRMGMVLTSVAGPASNLVLALLGAVLYGLLIRFAPSVVARGSAVDVLCMYLVQVNIALAVFNVLPIPPLDGGRIVDGFVPPRWEDAWHRYCRVAPFVLAAVLIVPGFLGLGILDWPIRALSRVAMLIVVGVAAM
jgi:Zn-dependent protease